MPKELSQTEQRALFKADEKVRKETEGEWPKYAMASWSPDQPEDEKKRKFYTFAEAAALYDSGFHQVKFGVYVLYSDFTMRHMTEFDQGEISEAADEYSASK